MMTEKTFFQGRSKIFFFLLIVVLALSFFLTACSNNEPLVQHPEDYCVSDADCVPLPVCHPLRCINQESTKNYDAPEFCTQVYVENAAHSPDDCICQNNHCLNKNNPNSETNTQETNASINGVHLLDNSTTTTLPSTETTSPRFSSWLFQLQKASYSSIYKAPVDLIVSDPDETPLSKTDISSLHALDKTILAYLSIGEAEDYRSYWNDSWTVGNPSFLDEENPEWPGNYKVQYWNPAWQTIILNRAKELAEGGYDGLYLDIIDAYSYYEERGRSTAAQDMIDFVKEIARVTKAINPDFFIVPQNSPELYAYSDYANTIDGLGKEDTWFNEASKVPAEESKDDLRYLDKAVADGKFVLSIDYPLDPANICIYYSLCQSHHFVCTVSDRELDKPQPIPCNS